MDARILKYIKRSFEHQQLDRKVTICFLILLIAVPSLMNPKNEGDPAVRSAISEGRVKRMARLFIGTLLSHCQKVLDFGTYRRFLRTGGGTQLQEDFRKLAPSNVHWTSSLKQLDRKTRANSADPDQTRRNTVFATHSAMFLDIPTDSKMELFEFWDSCGKQLSKVGYLGDKIIEMNILHNTMFIKSTIKERRLDVIEYD